MDWLIPAVTVFLIATTSLHLLSIATVAVRTRRNLTHAVPLSAAVTIIRPVCGLENFIEETLRSTFRIDHNGYDVIFCAAKPGDPVIPLVRRLVAEHPHVPSQLLIGQSQISANPKLNNIAKGWDAARGDWIVMADSNVLIPRDIVTRLLATWRHDTGLVCSPPLGCAPDGLWAELECTILNTYQARWQCAADSAGFGFAQGKTMLWRRDFLAARGGAKALASEIAEDAAATKLVRSAGLRVRVVGQPFEQPLGRRNARDVWRRQVRWARLRRGTFPHLFAIEIFAGALPPLIACAILAAATGSSPILAVIALAAVWYGAEAALCRAAGWHFTTTTLAASLLRDLMLPAIWLSGWAGKGFEWRGNSMRIVESKQSA